VQKTDPVQQKKCAARDPDGVGSPSNTADPRIVKDNLVDVLRLIVNSYIYINTQIYELTLPVLISFFFAILVNPSTGLILGSGK